MPEPKAIDFTVLPPKLQVKLWVLALDANTSSVAIAYKANTFTTSLNYGYGGNISAHLVTPRFDLAAGVNPGSGALSGDLIFRGFKFGTTADFGKSAFSGTIGFGADLLPFPDQLSKTFSSANMGLMSMGGDIGSAPDNPLKWAGTHSNDIAAVKEAASQIKAIAETKKGVDSFGAKLKISHDPTSGLTITLGAGVRF